MSKTAIILGATGLTGGLLLDHLLCDDRYGKITLFSRSSCGITHDKIDEHLINLMDLSSHNELFLADEVFCCVGTTKAKTPNEELYTRIDFGIPFMAAQLCRHNNINTFVVVSALGADKESKIFYNRIKGSMEEAVLAQNILNTYILQPSLIGGIRKEKRFGEYIAKLLMRFLNPLFFGALKNYKSIPAITIAECMVILANGSHPSGRIVSDDIKKLVINK